jgi:A/G-specific adenine glycosylase
VGPYIAGAVLSCAFDRPAPIVEANTQRVLARLLAWDAPLGSSMTTRRLWEAAARLVPADRPGRFNQALMDLGALICTPVAPRCLVCPLAAWCEGRRRGEQDRLPVKASRAEVSAVAETAVVVEQGGRWLMVRRAEGGLWAGFWEFPTVHEAGPDPAGRRGTTFGAAPETALRDLTGLDLRLEPGPPVTSLTYGVTRYRVTLTVRRGEAVGRPSDLMPRPGPGFDAAEWLSPEQMAGVSRSAATRRVARHVFKAHGAERRGGPDDANV